MNKAIYSVSQVNNYITQIFRTNPVLLRLSIRGEVSNASYSTRGHIFFTLKDEESELTCVMFAGDRAGMSFHMKDGDRVVVTGQISVYPQKGRYQLYAKTIEQEGAGVLYARFLALKQELEDEGYFSDLYKKPIPYYVRKLGVVTASTGAAVHDIQTITHRRNPFVQVILCPAQVQGKGAAESIVHGIRVLDRMGLDCIIVGRGGGSIEDLWAFNERIVARAIFDADTPIISAVGHETDTTIADYVADMRAPTPSAGAELAVLDVRQLLRKLDEDRQILDRTMTRRLRDARVILDGYQGKIRMLSPENQIREKRMILTDYEKRLDAGMDGSLDRTRKGLTESGQLLERSMQQKLDLARHQLEVMVTRWEGLSPLKKLKMGYSYAETEEGQNISSVEDVALGQEYLLQVTDGTIRSLVQTVSRRNKEN